MHSKRIATALILGPLLFAALWWGGVTVFAGVLLGVTVLGLYEYYAAALPDSGARFHFSGVIVGSLPVLFAIVWNEPGLVLFSVYLAFLTSIFMFLGTFKRWRNVFQSWALFFMGLTYVGFCSAHLALIRGLPSGREWIIFLLVVIFSGDTGAYYTGSALGRHKLSPTISKGKTVEGAAGGLLFNILAGLLLWFFLFRKSDPWIFIALSVVIGVMGQIGDLAESMFKRSAGIKDSSSLLPGHGGVLDRGDGVLIAAPLLYWVLLLNESVSGAIK